MADKKDSVKKENFIDRLRRKSLEKRTKKKEPAEIKGIVRAVPVIMIAAALFITLCFITAETGAFGEFISSVLMGLFSYMAYTIPVFVVLHAISFYTDIKERKLGMKVLFSCAALVMLSMMAYIIPNLSSELVFSAKEFYNNGKVASGGGFVGGLFAFVLAKLIGKVGVIILVALAATLYVLYLTSGGASGLSRFLLKKLGKIADYFADLETKNQNKKKAKRDEKLVKQRAVDDKKNADFYNDEYFSADNGVSRLEIPELGILETKSGTAGTPFLRETVIKSDDEIKVEIPETHPAAEDKKRFIGVEIETEPVFVRTETPEKTFRSDDIVYEEVKNPYDFGIDSEAELSDSKAEINDTKDYSIDDSADTVFTASFDPFDLAMNEKRASKPSSKAKELEKDKSGFSEFVSDMTPEQFEQHKRLQEFERNRRAAIERKAAREAAEQASAKESVEKENTRIDSMREGKSVVSHSFEKVTATPSEENISPIFDAEEERAKEQARLANIVYSSAASKVTNTERDSRASLNADTLYSREEPIAKPVSSVTYDYKPSYNGISAHAPTSDSRRFDSVATVESGKAYRSDTTLIPNREERTVNSAFASPITTAEPEHFGARSAERSPIVETDANSYASTQRSAPAVTATEKTDYAEASSDDIKCGEAPAVTKTVKIDFEDADYIEAPTTTESSTEFNFAVSSEYSVDDKIEVDIAKNNVKYAASEDEITLEISRTMLDPTLNTENDIEEADNDAVDVEEEYIPYDELEPEEIVDKKEIPENERNPEIYAQRQMFDVFKDDKSIISDGAESLEDYSRGDMQSYDTEQDYESYEVSTEVIESDEPPFNDYTEHKNYEKPNPIEVKKEEKKKPVTVDYSNYKFPPLELLKKSKEEDWDSINKEIQYGGEQLINTLDSFNIKATIRGMEHGPRITRYSIVPAKGVRVNQIEKLADDIALALAAESIRIEAPIPGKSAVGVEVPNKVPSLVSLRDLLESDEFQSETSKTCVCIGKSVEGSLVYGDIGSMPHVLIAGATGMGKSVCINSLITSMLYKARPDEVKFIMIDPKKVEFAPYNGIPHLLVPVVTEPKQAAGALMWAVDEMNKRYDIIEKLCVKSIDSYNKKVSENPELGAPMSKIVIFIDELNDLMVQVRDPVENLIMLIAQKARAAGIHLVIGTQRPSVDVITGVIKANIPSRIACKVSSGIDSRTIIEQTGAEKLIGKGDMLFAPSGKAPKRVQGAFVSESETEAIVDFIKAQFKGEHYDEQALEDMRRAAQKCDKSKSGDGMDDYDDDENSGLGFLQDQKFLNAVELAIRNGSVATSFLQRKLKIGYGKAAQYIDIMEDQGIVGEKNGAKAREVKMTMEEWREMLNRRLDN